MMDPQAAYIEALQAANDALDAVDMSPYDGAFMVVLHGFDGRGQVAVMPVRAYHRQGNTMSVDGVMGAYTTRLDH